MPASSLPIPLARAILAAMPSAALARGMEIIVKRLEMRHPKLFSNLAKLPEATVFLTPSDLPHRFALQMGPKVDFTLVPIDAAPSAEIKASLADMVAMLEGREDGDALFFSRGIQVTGDTAVIVALRNTLDREEIDLYDEILSVCGPFAQPARLALDLVDKAARHFHARLASLHARLHEEGEHDEREKESS